MIKTLLFMIRNASVKNVILYMVGAAIGVVVSVVMSDSWQGMAEFSRDFVIVFPISIGIILAFSYVYSKGKMDGILDGTATERKTWKAWYKRHQEEIKEHGIKVEEPTPSMLQCPRREGHHD